MRETIEVPVSELRKSHWYQTLHNYRWGKPTYIKNGYTWPLDGHPMRHTKRKKGKR